MMKIKKIYNNLCWKFPAIRRLKNSLDVKSKYQQKKAIQRTTDLSVNQLEQLSHDFPVYTTEYFSANCWYGNNFAVKKILNINKNEPLKGVIEHGLYFGRLKSDSEMNYNSFKRVYTYSDYRKNALMEQGFSEDHVVVVGPYILGAPLQLSVDQLKLEKKKNGKTLLVFPSHSTEDILVNFDGITLIDSIEKIKYEHGFQFVLVCMYYKDIRERRHLKYLEKNYSVVTAGHKYDPNFLGRLRHIINLSDMTMSNSLGTHLGYCVALHRPHYLFLQDQEWEGRAPSQVDGFDQEYYRQLNLEKAELSEYFGKYSEIISPAQVEIVHKYWGPF